jgi:CheY-like chemotaxis protein
MGGLNLGNNKILLLDENYHNYGFIWWNLFEAGYKIEFVKSISEFLEKIRKNKYYDCYIVDIVAPPGDEAVWIEIEKKKKAENPGENPFLGLELLFSLFDSENSRVMIEPEITIKPCNIIIFTIENFKDDEILPLGISKNQVINKPYRTSDAFQKFLEEVFVNQKVVDIFKDKLTG